jgi:uncharacterized protein (DUF3820 family)
MFYIIEIDYSMNGYYKRAILLDSLEDKEIAQEKLKSYKEYTGPHFTILLELNENHNTKISTMLFGKYKGMHISLIPTNYLIWLYVENILTNDSIKAVLLDRAKSTKKEIDLHNQIVRKLAQEKEAREKQEIEYYKTHRFELM